MPTLKSIQLLTSSSFPLTNASEQNTTDGQFTLYFSLGTDPTLEEEDSSDDFSFDLEVVSTGGTATFGQDYYLVVQKETEEEEYLTSVGSPISLNNDDVSLFPTSANVDNGITAYGAFFTLLVRPIDDSIIEIDETIDLELKLTAKNLNGEEDTINYSDSDILNVEDFQLTPSISTYTPVIYETAVDFGDAVSFDGVDDYVQLADGSVAGALDEGSTAFTITGWIKPNSLSSDTTNHDIENVFLARATTGSNDNFELGITTDGKLNLYLDTDSGDTTIELGNGELTTGEWHSFALVFDSGSVTAYIDGTKYTGSVSGTELDSADGSPFTLGASTNVDTFYDGEIDELGIWNAALTASEINDIRYNTLSGNESNLVAYYNFEEDSVDGDTINDLTSNGNNGTFTNGDGDNLAPSLSFMGYVDIELNGEVSNQPGIILNYQIESDSTATQDEDYYNSQTDVSTTDGEPQTDSIFIAEGEDSARIYLTALPDTVVEGDENIKLTLLPDFNKALDLDGVNDYVDTNADIVDVTTADFTLEAWIKTTGTQEGIIVKTDGDTSWERGEKAFYLNGSGQAYFVGFGNSYIRGTTAVNDGEWHHVAVVWDYSSGTSGTGKIYVDGEDDTASSAYNANNSDSYISNNHIRIGAPNYGEAPNYFSGEIDEVRIWDKARTQTEIQETLYTTLSDTEENLVAHYNFNDDSVDGTTIYDISASSNNGSLVTDNQVLSLDGNGDYVELTDATVAGAFAEDSTAFTITGWIKPNSLSSDTTNHDIENVFLARASDAENDNFELGITIDGKLNLYLDTNSGDTTIELGNGELTTGEWHSFALVFDSGSVTAYIDGNEYTSSVNGTELDEADGSPFTLGGSLHVDTFFDGEIDELAIWNIARTEDEIQDNLDKKLVGTEDGLVAYYTFEDGNADDKSDNGNDGSLNGATTTVNNDVPIADNFTNSLAYDPFATNGSTYILETNQSAEITIQETDNYVVDIAVANEFGDDLSDGTNFVVVDENGNATFQVKLTSEPTEDVTVTISVNGTDNDLDFTPSNWDTYQSFTASNISTDSDISLTISGGNYSSETKQFSVSAVNDDDVTILKLTEGGAELEITPTVSITASSDATEGNEKESGVFTISLDTPAPSGGLLIPISVSSTGTEGTDYNFYADSFTYSGESALSFDGVDDYIELADGSVAGALGEGSTAFTITGWIKPNSLSSDSTNHNIENVFLARASDDENDNFELGITTDGKLNLYLDTNSGNNTIELGNGELTTGEWHSFALVFDSGSVTAYIDGNEYTSSVNGTELDEADGSPFTLGASIHIDTFYDGEIDEVRIWETAKTESEIQENLYTKLEGTEEGLVAYYNFDDVTTIIPDVTENGNNGTPYIAGNALSLNGSDEYVQISDTDELDFGTESFTVEAWVYDDPDSTVDFNNVVSKKAGGETTNGWTLRINSSDTPQFFLADGSSRVDVQDTTAITEGEWYHLAGVVDRTNNEASLYVNGALVATESIASLGGFSSSNDLVIGSWDVNSNQDYWYGQIDEVRIWNQARSSEEIQDNLYKKLEGTEDGLAAYYNFDSDVDTTINDSTDNGFDGTLVNGDSSNLTTSNIGYPLSDWAVTKTPVVKIAEGETQATITVSKIDNETVEAADETVTVTLEDWYNYEVDNNNQSATVTLNDDDEAGIEFAKLDTIGSVDNIAQEFIVSTAYDTNSGTVGITLNNGDNSYTFAQGTELTFDGGAVVTVNSATTIAASGETLVNVTFTQDSATEEITAEEISEIELVNIELSSFTESDTGTIAIFDVSLAQTPTEDVTVTLTDGNGTATATVTFTTSDWDTSQSVRMILESDFDLQVSTTSTNQQDTNYGNRNFDLPISTEIIPTSLEFYDNTLVTSEVAKIELEVTSDYSNGTVGLKLDSGAISYTLTAGTELSFSDGAVVTVDSDTTISTDDGGTSVAVTFSADSESSTITTDETADIELSGEDSTTFAVRLSSQPSDTVTLDLAIGDENTTEGAFASSASSQTLTFTTENWDTYQEVTLYGVDDSEDDDNIEYSIGVTASSNDSNYNEITDSITVTNLDNDEPVESVDDTDNSSDIIASLSLVDSGEITEGSTGQLQINLSEAAPVGGLKVRYTVSGGTATPDEDFEDLQGLVEYAYNTHENPLSQAHIGVLASEGEILKDFKLVDLDSDGDLDAVLAYDDNNLLTRYYRNDGSSSFPDFEELTGTDNPFENISGESIAFGDINNDGKQDFLLLDSNGDVFYYENTTENASDTPSFTLNATSVISNSSINQITLVDINSDGYLELFASLNDGTISYYEYDEVNTTFVENSGTNPLSSSLVDYSNNATIPELVPDFVDYDGDGDLDVFIGVSAVGSSENTIAYFENTGDVDNPSFEERTGNDNPFDGLAANDYYHPFLTDIDNDGDIDGFIAYESDSPEILVEYYENTFFQQVEIAEGETTANIDITTISDNIAEYDETIEVSLSAKPSQTYTFEITQGWTVSESDANSGTIGIQIINNSDIELIGLATGTELTFEDNNGNQVVFTVDEPTTVFTDEITNNVGTIISGTIAANSDTTIMAAGETTEFIDEGYRLFGNLKVTSGLTQTGDEIELLLDETNLSSLTLEAGTELTFSGGAIVSVTDEVTINNSSSSTVNIEFSEASDILTIGTDETTGSLVNLTSTVSIIDDDVAGITISGDTDGTTTLNTSEADAGDSNQDKTFNIVLDTKPADDKNVAVYVGVENSDEGLLSDDDETNENLVKLVFNSDNWDTSQQVTLSSVDDNIDDGDVSYNIITTVVSHDIFYHEDSVPLIVENDFDANADTSISISIDDLSIEELQISAGTQLTFTNGTILEVANSISLSNSEATNVNVTLIEGESISSTEIAYFQESISPDIAVTNADDDTAEVIVDTYDISSEEGYSNNYFNVKLATKPVGEVNVTMNPVDINGDKDYNISLADEFDGESYTVTFNEINWNLPQAVKVIAVDDYDIEYNHTSYVDFAVSSDEDSTYDAVSPPDDVIVKIEDNDLPSASVQAVAAATEAGSPGYFIVSLDNPAPDGFDGTGIVVNYSVSGTVDVDGSGETDDLKPITGSVRIAPGETRSPIIAFPIDDFKVESIPLVVTGFDSGTNTVTLEINTANLSDSQKESLIEVGTVTLDDDTEITFSGGAIANVISTSDNLQISSDGSVNSITAEIEITNDITIASDETTSIPKEAVVVTLVSGSDYLINEEEPPSAILSIQDNDTPGIRIVEIGDTTVVNEDGTAEFYISLLSQPEADVTISLAGSETERQIIVDQAYSNGATTIQLKVDDSEVNSLLLPAGTYTLGSATVTVTSDTTIFSDKFAEVGVSLSGDVSDSDSFTYSYTELSFDDTYTFTSNNWYELQTVTVKGIDDNVAETGDFHTSTVEYTVESKDENGEIADSNYDGFEVAPQTINIIDRTFDAENTAESLIEGFFALQDGLDSVSLPIIGNLDGVAPSFIEDFIGDLVEEIKQTEYVTAQTLQDAFNNVLSGRFGTVEVEITDLSATNIEFLVGIEDSLSESISVDGDLGLPALGIGIESDGSLDANFNYDIDLAFGINTEDGFYLNTEDTGFEVTADFGLSDNFSATGNLGFLELEVANGENVGGTGIDAEFVISLEDNNDSNGDNLQLTLSELNDLRKSDNLFDSIKYGFSGDAALDLDVTTSVEGNTGFPSFSFNLSSELPLFNYSNSGDEEEVSGATLTISGSQTSTEGSSITLNVTSDDDTNIIQLNKGTELKFGDDSVILSKTAYIQTGETPTTIYATVADDGDNNQTESVTIADGTTAELVSGDFNISFNEITLDLGGFVTDLMSPIINYVNDLIEPFEPIIDVLQTEIDLLDTLGLVDTFDENNDGKATLIEVASTLASTFSGNDLKYEQFFSAVTGIIDLVESLEDLESSISSGENLSVDFGDYTLENFKAASDNEDEDASNYDTENNGNSNLNENTKNQAKTAGSGSLGTKVTNFFSKLDDLGISIPLIEDPFTAINLFLGQDIDLVTYDIPELDIGFDISQEFPIFGSIKGLLEGGFSLYSDLVVGFDTYGLSQWEEEGFDLEYSYLILDGFYLSDVDPSTGEDVDELTLDATIAAGVSASAVVAKAEVKGGITGTASLDIIDGGEFTGNSDGKLRGSEILEADSLLDLFTLSGSLEAFVEALVKVGIDLGFYEIMKTVWKEEFSVTLFEFELGGSSGTVSQSYIEGAKVFFDANLDGIWQEGEPITTSNADGSYYLEIPLLYADTNENGKIDPEEGRIVTEGGTDTSSGVAVGTPLIAPFGAKMVTPLTTLKQKLIEDGSTPEEAEQSIKEALDLPDINLEEFDPLEAMAKGDERGSKVYKAHVQMQSLFTQTSEFMKGFDGEELEDKKRPIPEQAIDAIAKGIKKRKGKGKPPIDFNNSAELEELIKEPLEGKIKPKSAEKQEKLPKSFGVLAQTMASGNKEIDEAFKGVPPKDILGKVAPVKKITQDKLPKELRKLVGGPRREDITGLLERVPDAEQFLSENQSLPGNKPPMKDESGDKPLMKDESGNKPPMNGESGDKPLMKDESGDKPPMNGESGNKPPMNGESGNKPPMNGESGDKPVMKDEKSGETSKENQNPQTVLDSLENTTILPRKPKKLSKGKRPRNLLELDGDDLTDTKIKFSLSSKNLPPGRIHEIAIFTTEDAEGTINGLSPEDTAYKEAALKVARSIFSILPDDFIANPKRIMKGFANQNIGFLLIKNGTLDSVLREKTSLDNVVLGTETQGEGFRGIQMSETGESSFQLSFEDEFGAADFTDIVINAELTDETPEIGTDTQGGSEGETLDLRGYAGKQIKIEAPIVREESVYENVVGFYVVENETGAVIDPLTGNLLNPGDQGYTQAALRNSQNNAFQMGETGLSGSFEMGGGQMFAPFVIADGTLEQVLDDNPNNDPQVYFAYMSANSDGFDHIRNFGGNTWGCEDLPDGGDSDFNDIVFKLNVTVM